MKQLKDSSTLRRETPELYHGRAHSPMCIEVGPDGVFCWPKGTRTKVMVSLSGAYERGLAHQAGVDTSAGKRELGMSARKTSARKRRTT
jgi:hypothetical protein